MNTQILGHHMQGIHWSIADGVGPRTLRTEHMPSSLTSLIPINWKLVPGDSHLQMKT